MHETILNPLGLDLTHLTHHPSPPVTEVQIFIALDMPLFRHGGGRLRIDHLQSDPREKNMAKHNC